MSLTKSRLISQIKVKFNDPDLIEEVIVLRYDPKFLEMAVDQNKEPQFHSPMDTQRPLRKSPNVSNDRFLGRRRQPRQRPSARRQLFKVGVMSFRLSKSPQCCELTILSPHNPGKRGQRR